MMVLDIEYLICRTAQQFRGGQCLEQFEFLQSIDLPV
jgi:hypothetical protein